MPVSTPSYFPPNRINGSIVGITAGLDFNGARSFLSGSNAGNHSTLNDIIVLGDHALEAGPTDQTLNGTIVIGSQAAQALIQGDTQGHPNTIIGFNAAKVLQFGGGMVVIGDNAAANVVSAHSTPSDGSVVIGSHAAEFVGNPSSSNPFITGNVIIGSQAAQGSNGGNPGAGGVVSNSVVIGQGAAQAAGSLNGGVGMNACIVIGLQAGATMGSVGANSGIILVGTNSIVDPDIADSIFIGDGIHGVGNNAVGIGAGAAAIGSNAVVIGDHAAGLGGGVLNVILGSGAGTGAPTASNKFLVEVVSNTGLPPKRLIWGDFGDPGAGASDAANLVFGDSKSGVNDDFSTGSKNVVKLIDGVIGSTNVAGGGYMVSVGGAFNWVDSSGKVTTLATAGVLLTTTTVLLDGAGVAAGTLLNAPTAGNPTKWLELMDNGVLRKIPTWQ